MPMSSSSNGSSYSCMSMVEGEVVVQKPLGMHVWYQYLVFLDEWTILFQYWNKYNEYARMC